MLIAIGSLSGSGHVTQDYALSLAAMMWMHLPDTTYGLVKAESSIVANSRNMCVAGAMDMGADKLLMIDADMVFPANTLARLLNHQVDIVAGLYKRRGPPYKILGTPLYPAEGNIYTGLVEMRQIPTGCILIDMAVFKSLGRPYFRFGAENGVIVGEDIQFCEDARMAGYKLWADCDLELGHLTTTVLKND